MARLPRLVLPGQPHHLIQHGHNRQPVFLDDDDRRAWLDALREASALHRVALHAWLLMDDHVHLVLTPSSADGLARMMQTIGRRYVVAFNRRHGRSGTLWAGRYRVAPVEAPEWLLACMQFVDAHPVRAGRVDDAGDWPWSSAAHHLGRRRDPLVQDPPAWWGLGNTPFDREALWRRRLEEGQGADLLARITDATLKGWALGSGTFLAQVAALTDRPAAPRPRGRPPRRTADDSGPN